MSSFATMDTSGLAEIVMKNLRNFVEDFKSSLLEIQKTAPSVPGFINDMDFQQFSAFNVFFNLIEMQESVNDDKLAYLQLTEEQNDQIKLWALQMESEAKRIFGKEYDGLLASAKQDFSLTNGDA